jgi:cytochrome c biogenesis protein CcmG/thiol:disulfide interchange protein DsbE
MTEVVESSSSTSVEPEKRRFGIYAITAVAVIFVAILALGMFNSRVDRPDEVAPDFEMKFFDGYEWQDAPTANLSEMKGHPVVLNFWASWCVECIREAELLEDMWQEYGDQGVVFLGIAYVDIEPNSIAYLEKYGITYPNAPDLQTAISSKYDITGVPETFFIEKNGDVKYIHLSAVNETMVRSLLDEMVASEGTESG